MKAIIATLILFSVALAGCETNDAPDDGDTTTAPDPFERMYWPFLDATIVEGTAFTVFGQWPVVGLEPPRPSRIGLEWFAPESGFLSDIAPDAGDSVSLGNITITGISADDAGPRFGMDGYNATQATIYGWFETRDLVAYTDDVSLTDIGRVPWTNPDFVGDPIIIDNTNDDESLKVYYLGNGTAPEGTEYPPEFLQPFVPKIREVLHGLPVGGVAAAVVPAEEWPPYGTFTGYDLYVTAKVQGLTHAP